MSVFYFNATPIIFMPVERCLSLFGSWIISLRLLDYEFIKRFLKSCCDRIHHDNNYNYYRLEMANVCMLSRCIFAMSMMQREIRSTF